MKNGKNDDLADKMKKHDKKAKNLLEHSKQVLENPRLFIEDWFKKNKISLRDADERKIDSVCLDYKELLDVYKFNGGKKINRINNSFLEMAFREHIVKGLDREIKNDSQAVFCDKLDENGEAELSKWVLAVTGVKDELVLKVMQHWLWSIKRNIKELPVIHHIMPILFGKQGSGKSLAIKKISSTLSNLTTTASMMDLGDSRCYQLMAQNYIMFFDELQGLERTDVNALKRQITAENNTYRILGTHSYKTVRMRCSFIGATNRSISELIYDPTGMRRFYEIKTLDKLDWTTVNNINYKSIWHSIDDSLELGYLVDNYLELLYNAQKQTSHIDPIIEFMTENFIMPGENEYKEVSSKELYNAYTFWANGAGYKNIASRQSITKKLISHGLPSFEIDQRKYFKINPKCDIISTDTLVKKTILPFKKGE